MSSKKPADEKISHIAPFGLRMLPDLRDRITASAEAGGRSLNAEIVRRLEESFINGYEGQAGRDVALLIKLLDEKQRVIDEFKNLSAGYYFTIVQSAKMMQLYSEKVSANVPEMPADIEQYVKDMQTISEELLSRFESRLKEVTAQAEAARTDNDAPALKAKRPRKK